jgi:hypothetical protein
VYTIESEIVGNPGGGGSTCPAWGTALCFDPDSICHCFPRYRRVMSPTGRVSIEERVIAPVPRLLSANDARLIAMLSREHSHQSRGKRRQRLFSAREIYARSESAILLAMTNDERMQREPNLIATIRKKLSEFAKACADDAELVLLHQDALAAV